MNLVRLIKALGFALTIGSHFSIFLIEDLKVSVNEVQLKGVS